MTILFPAEGKKVMDLYAFCLLLDGNMSILCSFYTETWKRFKEEEDNQKEFPKTRTCEDGFREVVKFLYPDQLESLCSS